MANHPSRGRPNDSPIPDRETIFAARTAAGLTQTQAGGLVHTTLNTWQKWEAGDRRMHPAFWELFRIKVGQVTPR